MDKLQSASGEAFDAMFLEMMSSHHQGGARVAQAALSKARHTEIEDMAKKIADEQKREIDQMSTWKKAWKLAGK